MVFFKSTCCIYVNEFSLKENYTIVTWLLAKNFLNTQENKCIALKMDNVGPWPLGRHLGWGQRCPPPNRHEGLCLFTPPGKYSSGP